MNKLEEIVTSAEPEARKILEEFVHSFAEAIKENNILKQKIDYIAHDNRLLRKKLFGSSSEKLAMEEPATQDELYLFNEFELVAQEVSLEEVEPVDIPVNAPLTRKKTGRKNWLFSNSVEGANASANLFSLIESAKICGLDPVKYLTHVFKELPNCKMVADYEALLPFAVCDEKLKISK